MTIAIRRSIAAPLALAVLFSPALAQQSPRVGPTFASELAAAGCTNGVAWTSDGALWVDPAQPTAVQSCAQQVLAAHDPTKQIPVPRVAPLSGLLDPLSSAQRAAITPDHLLRLEAEAAGHPGGALPITNAKVVRAAADLGLTPDAWFKLGGY